jgi:hypothetical protein
MMQLSRHNPHYIPPNFTPDDDSAVRGIDPPSSTSSHANRGQSRDLAIGFAAVTALLLLGRALT